MYFNTTKKKSLQTKLYLNKIIPVGQIIKSSSFIFTTMWHWSKLCTVIYEYDFDYKK